ncbi:MAG: hypothetical protein OFPII_27970 [Osedax symbiont Rs1]|nr:MAG: hypothetical protein OFPII_27970 [Osedax symbiont Rs1]
MKQSSDALIFKKTYHTCSALIEHLNLISSTDHCQLATFMLKILIAVQPDHYQG